MDKETLLIVIKDSGRCCCYQPTFLPDENQWEPGWKCDYCVEFDKLVEEYSVGRSVKYVHPKRQATDDLPF